MPTILAGLALILAHAFAAAAEINVVALTAGKAVVVINNGKPQTMVTGQVSSDGVRLIDATSELATFEVGGKRQTLTMGQSLSFGGASAGAQRAMLVADTGGHFLAIVAINGMSMKFIVDTGASLVTLSSSDARRAGINYLAGERTALQTANGVTTAYRVKLDTVRLGEITLNSVDGVVVEGNATGGIGLLGLSFLNRLIMQRDGSTMTLTRRF